MKAILVIDKPSSCIDCRYSLLGGCYCVLTQKDGDISEFCPFKPLPNKIDQGYPCEKYDEGYSDGWDACIDEILGEKQMKDKSVLILDTPKSCTECLFYDFSKGDWRCNINNEKIFRCPLIPLEDKTLKYGNKEYIIYERNFLYKHLEKEIEILREGKKFYEGHTVDE